MVSPKIIDADTGHDLWTANECAQFCQIARSSWTTYSSRGMAPNPVARFHGLTLWDAAEVKEWHSSRPPQQGR